MDIVMTPAMMSSLNYSVTANEVDVAELHDCFSIVSLSPT